MLVLLHGFGAPGTDLVGLAGALQVPPATRLVFLEAPLSLRAYGYADGRAWWMIDIMRMQALVQTGTTSVDAEIPDGLNQARDLLSEALDSIAAQMGATELALGGFSQGAMLACHLAATDTRALKALVLLSGTLLAETVWRAGFAQRPALPVFQSHGEQDPILSFAASQRLRVLLTEAGAELTFVSFAGGHAIPPPVLNGLNQFLALHL